MVSLLLISLTCVAVKSQIASICIWGRYNDNNFNTAMNGQYAYDGLTNDGFVSYKLERCSETWYVYRHTWDTQWNLSDDKESPFYSAACTETDITSCTAGKWSVVGTSGSLETAPKMYTKAGDCPIWDCATISTNSDVTFCQEFGTLLGDNAWESSNGYVWYFNPVWWVWTCLDNPVQYGCDTTFIIAAEGPEWHNLSSGDTVSLTTVTTSSEVISVNCIGTANLPTPQPSTPTTPNPNPTPKPTLKPTSKPTPKPTLKPVTVSGPQPTPQPASIPSSPPGTPTTPTTATTPTTPGIDGDDDDDDDDVYVTINCIGISKLDNDDLNGKWYDGGETDASGYVIYSLDNYWLYFVDSGSHRYWMISEVYGSSDWSNIIAYCSRDDLTHCSEVFWVWSDDIDDFVEDTDSKVIECDEDDIFGIAADVLSGLVAMTWIWTIIGVVVCLCCTGCIILCICKSRKGKAYFETNREDDYL